MTCVHSLCLHTIFQMCFRSPQSIGVIGGKPNQALYLVGCVGDEVIYLDPHTTQRSGAVEVGTKNVYYLQEII